MKTHNLGQLREPKLKGKVQMRALEYTKNFSAFYKNNFAYRLYWGRSNLYKKLLHSLVITLTLIVTFTGFSSRFLASNNKSRTIVADSITLGNVDLLEQGGSVQSILVANPTGNFKIREYTVQEGDTYDSISRNFRVTVESIKLSNADKISYYDSEPPKNVKLRIADINGVLIDVKDAQPVDTFMKKLTAGSKLDVIEINNLKEPNYEIAANTVILVPDGAYPPPPPPIPSIIFSPPPAPAPIPTPSEAVLAGVQFIDPLSHPDCNGYGYSRGYSSWHNGIDLPRYGGCPIRAAAAGTVDFAGWSSGGEGFMVTINHGNGVRTAYFHGDGQVWVTVGQNIPAGQDIMYMGCTGYCTGTHLHFSLKYNGSFIDASPFVPYWRP